MLTWEQIICEYYMAHDLVNRHPVDIWPSDVYPENHGAAPPCHTQRVLGNWGKAGGTAGALSCRRHRQCHSQTLQGHSPPKHHCQSQCCQASEPPCAASVTQSCYKYSSARWSSLAASEAWWINSSATLLMQEVWNAFFREETWKAEILRKKKLSAWRECIGNLGTKRSFAILSVYFPCTEYWFLAKKKITNWGNLKK